MQRFWMTVTLSLMIAFVGLSSARAAAPYTIAVLGDSLVAGYGIDRQDAFPARLEAALRGYGYAVSVINGGVSGDTTAQGKLRLPEMLAGKPNMVILVLGANDVFQHVPVEQTKANLDAMITEIQKAKARPLLVGVRMPREAGVEEYLAAFHGIFPALSAKHRVALYPSFREAAAKKPGLNLEDGIHPSAAGVKEIVRQFTPQVIELMERDGVKAVKP
ncbi:MAG: arylesterase [Alphaproteobacteria bacterium]|nr:arylesterase [Alphaproteobacteria bacterium]